MFVEDVSVVRLQVVFSSSDCGRFLRLQHVGTCSPLVKLQLHWKVVFSSWELVQSNIIMLFISVVFSMKISRMHYFQSKLNTSDAIFPFHLWVHLMTSLLHLPHSLLCFTLRRESKWVSFALLTLFPTCFSMTRKPFSLCQKSPCNLSVENLFFTLPLQTAFCIQEKIKKIPCKELPWGKTHRSVDLSEPGFIR